MDKDESKVQQSRLREPWKAAKDSGPSGLETEGKIEKAVGKVQNATGLVPRAGPSGPVK